MPENPVAQDTHTGRIARRRHPRRARRRWPEGPVAAEGEPESGARREDGTPIWPLPATLHPLVTSMPADAERSVEGVARYIAERERDPWLRVKALHDYVADRIAYDADAYRRRDFDGQDAATVLQRRQAVCAGYANLPAALGRSRATTSAWCPATRGSTARTSPARATPGTSPASASAGVLIDATWDAGHVNERGFEKEYGTDYLFAPPEIQGVTHFPRSRAGSCASRRSPAASSSASPCCGALLRRWVHARLTRSLAGDGPGAAEIALTNRRGRYLLAKTEREGGSGEAGARSPTTARTRACAATCPTKGATGCGSTRTASATATTTGWQSCTCRTAPTSGRPATTATNGFALRERPAVEDFDVRAGRLMFRPVTTTTTFRNPDGLAFMSAATGAAPRSSTIIWCSSSIHAIASSISSSETSTVRSTYRSASRERQAPSSSIDAPASSAMLAPARRTPADPGAPTPRGTGFASGWTPTPAAVAWPPFKRSPSPRSPRLLPVPTRTRSTSGQVLQDLRPTVPPPAITSGSL